MIWWILGWYAIGLVGTVCGQVFETALDQTLTIENIFFVFILAFLGPISFFLNLGYILSRVYENNKRFFTRNLLEKKK